MVYMWASGIYTYWSGYLVGLCVSGWLGEWKGLGEVTHGVSSLPSRLQALIAYSLHNKAITGLSWAPS